MDRREFWRRRNEDPVGLWHSLAKEARDPEVRSLYTKFAEAEVERLASPVPSIASDNSELYKAQDLLYFAETGPTRWEKWKWRLSDAWAGVKSVLAGISEVADRGAWAWILLLGITTIYGVFGVVPITLTIIGIIISILILGVVMEYDQEGHLMASRILLPIWLVAAVVVSTTVTVNSGYAYAFDHKPKDHSYYLIRDGSVVDITTFRGGNVDLRVMPARRPFLDRVERYAHETHILTHEFKAKMDPSVSGLERRLVYQAGIDYVLLPSTESVLPSPVGAETIQGEADVLESRMKFFLRELTHPLAERAPTEEEIREAISPVSHPFFKIQVSKVLIINTGMEILVEGKWMPWGDGPTQGNK